ncbi:MAG: hypothetical protein ACM3JH_13925 [Acidithiobacillales bacterium]
MSRRRPRPRLEQAKAEPSPSPRAAGREAPAGRRPLRAALLVTALVLVLAADERYFGLVMDGRIMVRTAVSMVTLGEIGIARGQAVGIDRPGGDSVSRYGLGPSLTLALPVFLARVFERGIGPCASQTLFVLHQILCLLGAAAGAGALAGAWGGDRRAIFRAALATVLGSPLWAYAGADFSEPLLAALIAAAFAASSAAVAPGVSTRRALALSAAAGAAAGFALLSKSLFVVVLPVVLALLVPGGAKAGRLRRAAAALLGWVPPAALWLVFEMVRFGRPFGGYAGERFSHPVLDGLWRLTIGPNKGLLLYFPLSLLSVVGIVALRRRSRVAAACAAGFVGLLLFATAAWWAWDGTFGWGPRLLLPAIPVLAALAALGAGRFRPAVFRVLLALGVAVNAIGVLQPDDDVMAYFGILPRRGLTSAEAARYPRFTYDPDPATSGALLDDQFWVAGIPALSPLRVAPWLLFQRLRGGDVAARLRTPPWRTDRPDLCPEMPPEKAIPAAKFAHLTRPFAWPHLGMSLFRKKADIYWGAAYTEGILDQALRAQDMGRADRAVDFAEQLWTILPGPQAAVVLAESYRIAGRREALRELADHVRGRRPMDPLFPVVLALYARDAGDADAARSFVEMSLSIEERPAIRRLLGPPVASWPATLRDATGENRKPR